jgi:hypothetical protein
MGEIYETAEIYIPNLIKIGSSIQKLIGRVHGYKGTGRAM